VTASAEPFRLPRSLTIDVTQADIDAGVVSNCDCPIAIAFRRAARTWYGVFVDKWNIRADEPFEYSAGLAGGANTVQYGMPEEASRFVEAFDDPCAHGPVGPFSFSVTAVNDR